MKPNGYFVTKRETCKSCQGRRITQHPAWYEYWKERCYQNNEPPMEMRIWFAARGYSPTNMPPEEIDCPDCAGQGYVESEVPLADILLEVLPGLIDTMGLVRRS